MDGHRNREPVHKYIETVRVWRDSSRGNEVILSYNNPGRGRGGEQNLFYKIWSIFGIIETYL